MIWVTAEAEPPRQRRGRGRSGECAATRALSCAARALAAHAGLSGQFIGGLSRTRLPLRPGSARGGAVRRGADGGTSEPDASGGAPAGRLIQRREVAEGECVGYNHTWRAPRASRIAKGGGQRRHERLVGNSQPTHKQQRSRQDPAKCRQRNACSTAVIRELSSLFKWQDWS